MDRVPDSRAKHTDESIRALGNAFLEMSGKANVPRYLVTLYKGIGDAVSVGLSAVDQIIKSDVEAEGKIDVMCNSIQAEVFKHDPRVNSIILASESLFSAPEVTMWLKGIIPDSKPSELVLFLRNRHYSAVFPGMFAPGFYSRLHLPVMYPGLLELGKDFLALREQKNVPIYKIARRMVSRYFGNNAPVTEMSDEVPLYLCSDQVRNAITVVRDVKKRSNVSTETGRLLVVASDTTSVVTRPPVNLLATSIAEALRRCHGLIVCILQGHTDANAALQLWQALSSDFEGRVFMLPSQLRAGLLDVTAFIDQADIFVTGDTGLMHLAAATKRLREGETTEICPKNSMKIIALFGGTSPSLYGYPERTIILGRGRKEQVAFKPGIAKESYNPKGRNVFDHIPAHQLTEAIIS